MSKSSRSAPASAMVRPAVVVPPQFSPAPPAAEPVYAWPSKVRCPHCNRTDAKVNGVQGPVRYMQCRHASCKRTFKVLGKQI